MTTETIEQQASQFDQEADKNLAIINTWLAIRKLEAEQDRINSMIPEKKGYWK